MKPNSRLLKKSAVPSLPLKRRRDLLYVTDLSPKKNTADNVKMTARESLKSVRDKKEKLPNLINFSRSKRPLVDSLLLTMCLLSLKKKSWLERGAFRTISNALQKLNRQCVSNSRLLLLPKIAEVKPSL